MPAASSARVTIAAALLMLALLSSGAAAARPWPVLPNLHDDDLLPQAPSSPMAQGADLARLDLSRMGCPQAQEYMAEFERQLSAPRSMRLDLERTCMSLRGVIQKGLPRCPEFHAVGTLAKVLRVCKLATNNGMLTCPTNSAFSAVAC